jgi:hypothetical protein
VPESTEPKPFAVWAKDFTSASVVLAEHVLSVPWRDNTIKARQLLLATSAGAVLVLVGARQSTDSLWTQIRSLLGADVLLVFVALLLGYALVAYFIASANDIKRYELVAGQRTVDYTAQLASLTQAREQLRAQLDEGDDPPEAIRDMRLELQSATSRVKDLESAMTDSSSRSAIAELRFVMARRDRLEERVEAWQRERYAKVTGAMLGLLNYAQAPETIDITTNKLFTTAKRSYRFQAVFERWGAMLFGGAVLLRLGLRIF